MPSGYAHLRFGKDAIPLAPAHVQPVLSRFRQLYDVGLQGPDFLFYYNPLMPTETGRLGTRFHMQSGKTFFGRAVRRFRRTPSEGGKAYLFGVLGHYCLDSVCHPFVRETAEGGKIGHTELETEFDRFLLETDGKLPPHTQRMDEFFRLSPRECITAARFYRGVTPITVERCLQNMRGVNRLVTARSRNMVNALMRFGGETGRQMVMTLSANENCAFLDEKMLELYEQALERYPRLASQLEAAINGSELGDDFAACFG